MTSLPELEIALERAEGRLSLSPDSAQRMTDRQLAGDLRRAAAVFDSRHLNAKVLLEAADRLEAKAP